MVQLAQAEMLQQVFLNVTAKLCLKMITDFMKGK